MRCARISRVGTRRCCAFARRQCVCHASSLPPPRALWRAGPPFLTQARWWHALDQRSRHLAWVMHMDKRVCLCVNEKKDEAA